MKVVVDTNVVAYFLLGTEPYATECTGFWKKAGAVWAPASWQAEIVNVLWMAVRNKIFTADESARRLRLAAGLGVHSVPVRHLWRGALMRSIEATISTYDSLFVELAHRRKLKLATFDRQLLRLFPAIAKRPSDLG
jgi:predicted nucleic acid-binding protein